MLIQSLQKTHKFIHRFAALLTYFYFKTIE